MDNSFFLYLENLGVIAFFSGYSFLFLLIYSLRSFFEGKKQYWSLVEKSIPIGYALTGLFFIGYQCKKAAPEYRFHDIVPAINGHWLFWWACLSLLFFISFFARKTILSFLHSLVFFIVIARDILGYIFRSTDVSFVQNDLSLLLKSIVFQTIVFLLVLGIQFFLQRRTSRI